MFTQQSTFRAAAHSHPQVTYFPSDTHFVIWQVRDGQHVHQRGIENSEFRRCRSKPAGHGRRPVLEASFDGCTRAEIVRRGCSGLYAGLRAGDG